MGGKNRKKVKSTQLKKGQVEDKKCSKPPLQVEDKGDKENDQEAEVSSQGDLPAVEKTMTALHLDEQTETKIDELKNNNVTPPIKVAPTDELVCGFSIINHKKRHEETPFEVRTHKKLLPPFKKSRYSSFGSSVSCRCLLNVPCQGMARLVSSAWPTGHGPWQS